MAQAAHASTAILSKTFNQPLTQAYVCDQNLPHMHKIVLQTSDKMNLTQLSEKLTEAETKFREEGSQDEEGFPEHYLWIELPENIPTCLAMAPNRKPAVGDKKMKRLFRQKSMQLKSLAVLV